MRIDRKAASKAKSTPGIFTRNGHDWTDKFSRQVKALGQLDVDSAWLDGEAVVLDDNDLPSFQKLQNAFDTNRPQDIAVYFFDIPYLNGYDLRGVPLVHVERSCRRCWNRSMTTRCASRRTSNSAPTIC